MNTSEVKKVLGKVFDEDDRLEAEEKLKEKWDGNLDKVIRPPAGFAGIAVPPREPIMGKWFKQGDLGFIYGPRGSGKTWLGMFLARRCAEGPGSMGALAEWNVPAQRRVLYVDGEMTMDEIRDRDNAMAIGPAPGIFYPFPPRPVRQWRCHRTSREALPHPVHPVHPVKKMFRVLRVFRGSSRLAAPKSDEGGSLVLDLSRMECRRSDSHCRAAPVFAQKLRPGRS